MIRGQWVPSNNLMHDFLRKIEILWQELCIIQFLVIIWLLQIFPYVICAKFCGNQLPIALSEAKLYVWIWIMEIIYWWKGSLYWLYLHMFIFILDGDSFLLVIDTSGPFYLHGLTLIPAWISNYMPSKVWDKITYPFLNFNSCTVEV